MSPWKRLADAYRSWNGYRAHCRQDAARRRVCVYAEDAASWSHLGPVTRECLKSRPVTYLTSDPEDPLLRDAPDGLSVFYIGSGFARTWAFLNLRSDVMLLTMPDLDRFHLKKSRVHPVQYVYLFHSLVSTHMIYRTGAFDAYDTMLCCGPHHHAEIRATEKQRGLEPRRCIAQGYGRLEHIMELRKEHRTSPSDARPHVLVAPSWGPHGLLERHGETVIQELLGSGLRVTCRPHPRTRELTPEVISVIRDRFSGNPHFELELDVASVSSLLEADVLVSDWSGAAFEAALGTLTPVLFVDVPRKINNPEHAAIPCTPVEVSLRESLGEVLAEESLDEIGVACQRLLHERPAYRCSLEELRDRLVYGVGESGVRGAAAIESLLGGEPCPWELGDCPAPVDLVRSTSKESAR